MSSLNLPTPDADRFQGMRVMSITLQKATNGAGPADWDKLFLT